MHDNCGYKFFRVKVKKDSQGETVTEERTFIQIVENMLKLPAPPLEPGQWTPERWRREQQGEIIEGDEK